MLSHEMHMKTIANDRFSARTKEAEVHRLTRTNRRSFSALKSIAKAGAAARSVVLALSTSKPLTIDDRRLLS